MKNYIAIIHKEDESDYGVSFPDFPGCVTAGDTLDEAKDMAQEALDLHIEGMIEDSEEIPEPSSLESIRNKYKDVMAYFVVSGKTPDKAVRINTTIQESLLKKIDNFAEEHDLTRAGFFAHAARMALGSVERTQRATVKGVDSRSSGRARFSKTPRSRFIHKKQHA